MTALLTGRHATIWTFRLPPATSWRPITRYLSGLAIMIRRGPEHNRDAAAKYIQHRDDCRYSSPPGGRRRQVDYAPGGIFDPRLAGLSVDAARINAAVCRHPYLRPRF